MRSGLFGYGVGCAWAAGMATAPSSAAAVRLARFPIALMLALLDCALERRTSIAPSGARRVRLRFANALYRTILAQTSHTVKFHQSTSA
jgi:hypothetical protein